MEAARLPRPTRQPRVSWLRWDGAGEPDLDLLWRGYVRRFDLEYVLGAFAGAGFARKPAKGGRGSRQKRFAMSFQGPRKTLMVKTQA